MLNILRRVGIALLWAVFLAFCLCPLWAFLDLAYGYGSGSLVEAAKEVGMVHMGILVLLQAGLLLGFACIYRRSSR